VCNVQIENEYGSYRDVDCGHEYMAHLHDIARSHLGHDVILFTTDGNSLDLLKCGATNNTYATVDFGPTAGLSASTDDFCAFIDRATKPLGMQAGIFGACPEPG